MCGKEGRRKDWISFRLVAPEDGGVNLSRDDGEGMSFGVRLVFQTWRGELANASRNADEFWACGEHGRWVALSCNRTLQTLQRARTGVVAVVEGIQEAVGGEERSGEAYCVMRARHTEMRL